MEARPQSSKPACNQSLIVGELVQPPEVRNLPSGESLVSFSLTVRNDGEKTTSVPLTWFSPPKKVFRWKEGDTIVAIGPVVRRFYHAGGRTGSRTDVSVTHADRIGHGVRALEIVNRAIEAATEVHLRLSA